MDILTGGNYGAEASSKRKNNGKGWGCAVEKLAKLFALLSFAALLTLARDACAAERLLAEANLELAGGKAQAELWGDELKNGYARKLLLLLKRDGKVISAYAPSVNGGYNCLLEPVRVKKEGGEQLLLSAGQGDWRAPTEFRVIDFSDLKKIREILSGAQNVGLIATAAFTDATQGELELKYADGGSSHVKLELDASGADGLYYGGIDSLVPYDADGDGCQELFASQQVSTRSRLLLDLGWVFKLKESGGWDVSGITILKNTAGASAGGINDGRHFAQGSLLARKLVTDFGEATFPVFAGSDLKIKGNIDEALAGEIKSHLKHFFADGWDLAFRILRSDDLLLSVQLVRSKDGLVTCRNINIDPATGKRLELADILNLKTKGLLEAINEACEGTLAEIPREWFIEEGRLHLLPGAAVPALEKAVELERLKRYLRDRKWLPQKLTDQSAKQEKPRKQEKKEAMKS